MSKLVTLSLKLVERLEEMGLITEEAEEFVEDVEDNLEDSLQGFVRIAEGLLASDFGDLSVLENRERFGQRISILGVKIRRLQDDIENLGDLVEHVTGKVLRD